MIMRISAILSALLICTASPLFGQSDLTITFNDNVRVEGVRPFGLNVGSRSRWGAAQILKNLIDNPGFEAGEMGMVALAAEGSTGTTFRQAFWDPAWGGQSEGFWDGAEYEIVWGESEGRNGTVEAFRHENGAYVFDLGSEGTAPAENDVMFVRTEVPGINGNTAIADPNEARPGSPGTQSMRLSAEGERMWTFYMDSYWRDGDTSIGKMLPIEGAWFAAVWAKGTGAGERVRIRFFREGEANFLDDTLELTDSWQEFVVPFDVAPGADPAGQYGPDDYRPILGFRLEALDGTAWFDDVELARAEEVNFSTFTDLFVQRLRELRPGLLRDWSSQLGSSLDNQLSDPWGRKTNGYKPGGGAGAYSYSLHEFLILCDVVDADPWYVVPPTFSPDDLHNLIEYLAAPATDDHPYAMKRAALGRATPWTDVFRTIHLEFGNELWGGANSGDPFQGASLRGGVRLGAIASDRFGIMRENEFFSTEKFDLIIGGQAGYPGRQQEIESNADEHTSVALAPYFGELDTWDNDQEIFRPLLANAESSASPGGRVRSSYEYLQNGGNGTRMGIYEINFHTTGGEAPIDIRNDFVTSAAGALALPSAMLTYQSEFDAVAQAAFSSLGYSFRMSNGDYVRVWGMLRDLYATGRKRPTWLGLELVNKAFPQWTHRLDYPASGMVAIGPTIQGGEIPEWLQEPVNGIPEEIVVDELQSFGFRGIDPDVAGVNYGMVLLNLSLTESREVKVRLRDKFAEQGIIGSITDVRHYMIAPESIHDDNEDAVSVRIDSVTHRPEFAELHDGFGITLPPHSIHVLRWDAQLTSGINEAEGASRVAIDSPNPLRPGLPVSVVLEHPGRSVLDLVDAAGRVVATLADRRFESGRHTVLFSESEGRIVPGAYLLRLRAEGEVTTAKVIVAD